MQSEVKRPCRLLPKPMRHDRRRPMRALRRPLRLRAQHVWRDGQLARSLLDTYVHGYERSALSGFTPAEQEVVLLAVSRENGCTYCVAAHSFIADKMSGVPEAVTNAIRDGQPIPDARLAALHDFTRTMVIKRGLPDKTDVSAFLAAGYSERQILEVVLAIAVKTLSNYANHLFHTPVDGMFAGRAWAD